VSKRRVPRVMPGRKPNAIIECCTREIGGRQLSLRCGAVEAIVVIEQAVAEHGVPSGTLTPSTRSWEVIVADIDHTTTGPAANSAGRRPAKHAPREPPHEVQDIPA
jgi:hypothetical protein